MPSPRFMARRVRASSRSAIVGAHSGTARCLGTGNGKILKCSHIIVHYRPDFCLMSHSANWYAHIQRDDK